MGIGAWNYLLLVSSILACGNIKSSPSLLLLCCLWLSIPPWGHGPSGFWQEVRGVSLRQQCHWEPAWWHGHRENASRKSHTYCFGIWNLISAHHLLKGPYLCIEGKEYVFMMLKSNNIQQIIETEISEWRFQSSEPFSQVLVAQSCLTLCNPMEYSPPGSSVRGILWIHLSNTDIITDC